MHAPFTLRSTLGEIKAAAPKRKRAWAIAVVVIVGVAVTTYFARRPLAVLDVRPLGGGLNSSIRKH